MELDQRVKALEYETKILKNEVQKVLLAIQEQILVHYYPSLRVDEMPPSDRAGLGVEAGQMRHTAELDEADSIQTPEVFNPALVKTVTLQPEAPLIKRVSLDQIRAGHTAASAPSEASRPATNPASLEKQFQWAIESAGKIGPEAVSGLIKVCAARGVIAKEMEQVLITAAQVTKAPATQPGDRYAQVRALLKLQAITEFKSGGDEILSMIEEAANG